MLEAPGDCIRNGQCLSGPLAAARRMLEARGLCVIVLCLSDWEDEKIDIALLLQKVVAIKSPWAFACTSLTQAQHVQNDLPPGADAGHRH